MSSRTLTAAGVTSLATLLLCTCATPQRAPMMMGDDACVQRLLIAAQQTEYKNAVLADVSKRLERDGLCMEVIDMVHLEQVEPESYDAMLISCEVRGQVRDGHVDTFLERLDPAATKRVVMLVTAGSPSLQQELVQVDGVTAASEMSTSADMASQLSHKVEALLAARSNTTETP